MNQIPNIEEEQADKELKARLHQIPHPADRAMLRRAIKKVLAVQSKTLHQQLQKGRQDWLREEIVKLEGMKTADYPSSLADPVGFSKCLGKNNTLQTIIDRYQFELDQDKK